MKIKIFISAAERTRLLNQTDTAVIIINPTSGRERAPRYLPLLQEVLSRRYAHVITKETGGAGDATAFAREAAEHRFNIVCMGGDGTINEVINGMMQVESSSVFAFIPFGTVNDLARALHIPRSPRGAIRMLETAEETRIDVGRVNGRYFINIVAAGLIPEAVSQVSIKEKTLFGSLAYFMKGIQALPRQKSYPFLIETEGGTAIRMNSPLMAAMLTDSAGSFRNLLPPEDRNKGVIKLALFRELDWLRLLRQGPLLLAGLQMGSDLLSVINVKKARISLTDGSELGTNVDGDRGPSFPLDIEILPDRLPVFVPLRRKNESLHAPYALKFIHDHFQRAIAERVAAIQTMADLHEPHKTFPGNETRKTIFDYMLESRKNDGN